MPTITTELDGTVVVSGLTFNDSSAPARTSNNAALQAGFDAIESGSGGTVKLAPDTDSDVADLYLTDTARPDQGTRRITLVYPQSVTLQGSAPVVSRVLTQIENGDYEHVSNEFPLNPGGRSRPSLLPNLGGAFGSMKQAVLTPDSENYIADRCDFIVPEHDYGGNTGNRIDVTKLYGMSASTCNFWANWSLMRSPVAHDSGLPNAPSAYQRGSMTLHEAARGNSVDLWSGLIRAPDREIAFPLRGNHVDAGFGGQLCTLASTFEYTSVQRRDCRPRCPR